MSYLDSSEVADEEETFYMQCRAAFLSVFRSSLTNISSKKELCRGKRFPNICKSLPFVVAQGPIFNDVASSQNKDHIRNVFSISNLQFLKLQMT